MSNHQSGRSLRRRHHHSSSNPSSPFHPGLRHYRYSAVECLIQNFMDRLGGRLSDMETELRYAWRALDTLSHEYIRMLEKMERLEFLLCEQQAVMSHLVSVCGGGQLQLPPSLSELQGSEYFQLALDEAVGAAGESMSPLAPNHPDLKQVIRRHDGWDTSEVYTSSDYQKYRNQNSRVTNENIEDVLDRFSNLDVRNRDVGNNRYPTSTDANNVFKQINSDSFQSSTNDQEYASFDQWDRDGLNIRRNVSPSSPLLSASTVKHSENDDEREDADEDSAQSHSRASPFRGSSPRSQMQMPTEKYSKGVDPGQQPRRRLPMRRRHYTDEGSFSQVGNFNSPNSSNDLTDLNKSEKSVSDAETSQVQQVQSETTDIKVETASAHQTDFQLQPEISNIVLTSPSQNNISIVKEKKPAKSVGPASTAIATVPAPKSWDTIDDLSSVKTPIGVNKFIPATSEKSEHNVQPEEPVYVNLISCRRPSDIDDIHEKLLEHENQLKESMNLDFKQGQHRASSEVHKQIDSNAKGQNLNYSRVYQQSDLSNRIGMTNDDVTDVSELIRSSPRYQLDDGLRLDDTYTPPNSYSNSPNNSLGRRRMLPNLSPKDLENIENTRSLVEKLILEHRMETQPEFNDMSLSNYLMPAAATNSLPSVQQVPNAPEVRQLQTSKSPIMDGDEILHQTAVVEETPIVNTEAEKASISKVDKVLLDENDLYKHLNSMSDASILNFSTQTDREQAAGVFRNVINYRNDHTIGPEVGKEPNLHTHIDQQSKLLSEIRGHNDSHYDNCAHNINTFSDVEPHNVQHEFDKSKFYDEPIHDDLAQMNFNLDPNDGYKESGVDYTQCQIADYDILTVQSCSEPSSDLCNYPLEHFTKIEERTSPEMQTPDERTKNIHTSDSNSEKIVTGNNHSKCEQSQTSNAQKHNITANQNEANKIPNKAQNQSVTRCTSKENDRPPDSNCSNEHISRSTKKPSSNPPRSNPQSELKRNNETPPSAETATWSLPRRSSFSSFFANITKDWKLSNTSVDSVPMNTAPPPPKRSVSGFLIGMFRDRSNSADSTTSRESVYSESAVDNHHIRHPYRYESEEYFDDDPLYLCNNYNSANSQNTCAILPGSPTELDETYHSIAQTRLQPEAKKVIRYDETTMGQSQLQKDQLDSEESKESKESAISLGMSDSRQNSEIFMEHDDSIRSSESAFYSTTGDHHEINARNDISPRDQIMMKVIASSNENQCSGGSIGENCNKKISVDSVQVEQNRSENSDKKVGLPNENCVITDDGPPPVIEDATGVDVQTGDNDPMTSKIEIDDKSETPKIVVDESEDVIISSSTDAIAQENQSPAESGGPDGKPKSKWASIMVSIRYFSCMKHHIIQYLKRALQSSIQNYETGKVRREFAHERIFLLKRCKFVYTSLLTCYTLTHCL
ncbi:hypothetical protein GQR58_024868 [Nymphon striatum]|nr:hypothetical protein GQR58_024868 [Nymphon striatum]